MKNFGNSSRGRSQGVPKIFRAPTCRAHCAVIFAIAQLSHRTPVSLYINIAKWMRHSFCTDRLLWAVQSAILATAGLVVIWLAGDVCIGRGAWGVQPAETTVWHGEGLDGTRTCSSTAAACTSPAWTPAAGTHTHAHTHTHTHQVTSVTCTAVLTAAKYYYSQQTHTSAYQPQCNLCPGNTGRWGRKITYVLYCVY